MQVSFEICLCQDEGRSKPETKNSAYWSTYKRAHEYLRHCGAAMMLKFCVEPIEICQFKVHKSKHSLGQTSYPFQDDSASPFYCTFTTILLTIVEFPSELKLWENFQTQNGLSFIGSHLKHRNFINVFVYRGHHSNSKRGPQEMAGMNKKQDANRRKEKKEAINWTTKNKTKVDNLSDAPAINGRCPQSINAKVLLHEETAAIEDSGADCVWGRSTNVN